MMARNMLVLGAHVTLVDQSQFALNEALVHFQQHHEFFPPHYKTLYKLLQSDINDPKAPYSQNKYWMVLCENVFHFQKPKEIHSMLDRIYDVLYPGGPFFASTIATFRSQKSIEEYLEGRKQGKEFPLPGTTGTGAIPFYTIHIALEELVAIIQKHGFFIEEAINIDARGKKTRKSCFDTNDQGIASCVIARKPLKS